jgi:hypothetical protein
MPGDLTRTGLELWRDAGAVLGELAADYADVAGFNDTVPGTGV